MEKEKNASSGGSKRKREEFAKKRKMRKIRKGILMGLAALIPLALILLIIGLVKGAQQKKDPSETADTTAPAVSSTGTQTSSETPGTSREEPGSSEVPDTTDSVPSESQEETPASTAQTEEPSLPEYGTYPSAAPIAVQGGVQMPSWIVQDLLLPSEINRPGTKLEKVNAIIIHYVGNTGSTAKDNRDYFQSQQDPREPSYMIQTSSNFIVDLDGTVLQCVPIDEVSYASYPRNFDTISVETCHINDAGEYTPETYAAMVKLSAWLLEIHDLTADDLLRHDDVRPVAKSCPKWFTDYPEYWEQFKNDVRAYMLAHPDIEHEFP